MDKQKNDTEKRRKQTTALTSWGWHAEIIGRELRPQS
jgi:hypothetical protein